MEIPPGPRGRQTLYTSRLRAYGAGGFVLEDQEEVAGCPRLYRARYIDHRLEAKQESATLHYGRAVHAALFAMEEHQLSIDEALGQCFPEQLGPIEFARAKADIEKYMERGGLTTRLSTIAIERTLCAELYVDDVYGPVDFAGILDWVGLDPDEDPIRTVHVGDYKSGFTVPSRKAVEGDAQLKAYSWLARNAYADLGLQDEPDVIVHLDAIRWRDIEHRYTDAELDEWQEWAAAVGRRILRDESAEPVLNPKCHWCPIKFDCKAYKRLPGRGVTVLERMTAQPLDKLLDWQAKAKEQMKILDGGVKEVQRILESRVAAEGTVEIEGTVFTNEPTETTTWHLPELHSQMGDDFYEVCSVTKASVERFLERRGQRLRSSELRAFMEKEPAGVRLSKADAASLTHGNDTSS